MLVSVGEIGQYTHRPCALPSGHAILFKEILYRGLNTGLVNARTRVGCVYLTRAAPSLIATAVGGQVRSLMVPPLTEVTLFSGPSFTGESISLTSSEPNLMSRRLKNGALWSRSVHSARVRRSYAPIVPVLTVTH